MNNELFYNFLNDILHQLEKFNYGKLNIYSKDQLESYYLLFTILKNLNIKGNVKILLGEEKIPRITSDNIYLIVMKVEDENKSRVTDFVNEVKKHNNIRLLLLSFTTEEDEEFLPTLEDPFTYLLPSKYQYIKFFGLFKALTQPIETLEILKQSFFSSINDEMIRYIKPIDKISLPLGVEKISEYMINSIKKGNYNHILLIDLGIGTTTFLRYISKKANLPVLEVDLTSVLKEYVGQSERNMRKLIKKMLSFAPALIIFRNIDNFLSLTLGSRKSEDTGTMENVIRILESNLDTLRTSGVSVVMLIKNPSLLFNNTFVPFLQNFTFKVPVYLPYNHFPPPPSVQECLTCKKVKFDGTYVQTVIENILTDLNKPNYKIEDSFVEYINTLLKKYVVITPKMIYNIVSTSLVVDKDQVLSVSDINLDYVTLPDEKELKLILTRVLTTIKPDPSLDNIYKLELPRILVEDLKRLYDVLVYGFKVSE